MWVAEQLPIPLDHVFTAGGTWLSDLLRLDGSGQKNVVFFSVRKNAIFSDTPAEVVDCIIPSSQPHQSVPKFPLALAISI